MRMRRWQSTEARCAISIRWLALGALISLSAGITQARIGESEMEIRTRYGDCILALPASGEAGQTKCYLSGGYSIAVTYSHDRSVREILTKADKSKITNKEIYNLLNANAEGSSWNLQLLTGQKNVPTGLSEWRTNGQSARVAFYDSREQAFFVTTQRFIDLTNATKRQPITRIDRGLMRGGSGVRMMRDLNTSTMMRGHQAQPSPSPHG